MSAYRDCVDVGDKGVETVMRWLAARHRVFDGRMVRTDKGRISLKLQTTVGDILFNSDQYTVMSIEVKTERRTRPNLFLETWSNASAEPGRQKEGWLCTLDADFLFYYFIDSDTLYTVDFQRLKKWAFEARRADGTAGRVFDFDEKPQRLHSQLNLTRGRCVPIDVLMREVGMRRWDLRCPDAEVVA